MFDIPLPGRFRSRGGDRGGGVTESLRLSVDRFSGSGSCLCESAAGGLESVIWIGRFRFGDSVGDEASSRFRFSNVAAVEDMVE
jgi:hypothetical protein